MNEDLKINLTEKIKFMILFCQKLKAKWIQNFK